MHVDEARTRYPTVSLNDPESLRLVKFADGGNPLATNANISVIPWIPGTIYYTTPANDKVKHFLPLCF